jgi:uncharacterized membrane protein
MEYLDNLLIGSILSAVISIVAYRRDSLSESGVIGAMILGTLIFGFGGWVWGLTLITFFVSSSVLSHYNSPATVVPHSTETQRVQMQLVNTPSPMTQRVSHNERST